MTPFAQALAQMGFKPVRAARASDYQSVAPPVSAGNTAADGMPRKKFANAVPLTGAPVETDAADDGNFLSGLGGLFKTVAGGALDAIDTPRAFVVSGVKELSDLLYDSPVGEAADWLTGTSAAERRENLERMGDASWNDFTSQGWRNMGFRELMDVGSGDTEGKDGPGHLYDILGFVGDVALDPTAWITLGASTAAKTAVKGSMRQAVTDGSGRALAKELADTAVQQGLREVPAVQQLVADAAMRGRGAITPRGLARAGIDDATREALGIPSLARTIGRDGVRLPGSTTVANVLEDVKGAAKRSLKQSNAATQFRKLAPNPLGQRNILQALASRAANNSEKFDAALALGAINRPLAEARDWAATTIETITKSDTLGKPLRKLRPEQGVVLTNAIENGLDDPMANEVRAVFRGVHAYAAERGVDIGYLGENYVPHMVSDEFRALARKNPEAAQILVGLDSDVGIQTRRKYGVNPGQERVFLGETLERGTIEELNGISLKKLGVKVFVDDVRDTLPRYIDQMSKAIARAQQIKMLTEKGVVRSRAVKMVKKAIPDSPEETKIINEAKAALKRARENEQVALRDGSVARRKELDVMRDAVYQRKREINAQVRELDRKIKDAQRGLVGAQMKHARHQQTLAALRASLDNWKNVAKAQRGAARKQALAQIKKIEARIKEVTKAMEVNQAAVTRIMGDETASFPQRVLESQTPMAGFRAWKSQRDQLMAEARELADKADELRTLKLGEGTMPAERFVADATEKFQAAQLENRGLTKEVKLAAHALDAAVADAKVVQDELAQAQVYLDMLLDKSRGGKLSDAEELRDRVAALQKLIAGDRDMDPVARMMAQFEAAAAAADAAALGARQEQATLKGLIDLMGTKRFQDVAEPYVEKGMVGIGENMQIPGWLNEALKIEPVRMNAMEANKFIRKFYNLWKGYAILRPGFHVRNAYSAMYNVYLEAGARALPNIRRAHAFDALAMKYPDNYMELAAKRWGDDEAKMLNEAYMAMRATGAGQAAGEFTSSEFHSGRWNPTSEDFRLLKRNRKIGEWVERKIRTAHAYDVLKRGGNIDQAIDVVNKWHFNYTDVSSFDRAIRISAMPFWTFYSRNIALQGQTWFRSAARLNRTYANIERNLSYGQQEDTDVPQWYKDAGALRLPGMDADGTTRYLFPDLPAVQAPGQFDKFTTPWTGQFLGDVGPAKLPLEIMAGKQFFSGIPLEAEGVEAGAAGSLLGALGAPLTGQAPDGTRMVDERLQYAINGLIPGASMTDRVMGLGGDANAERMNYSRLAALTGVGVRENNERTRQGERYRQMLEDQAAERYRQSMMGG